MSNPLRELQEYGQSIWLDYIQRGMLDEELPALIAEDGVRGVTSNPSILNQAITGSSDYGAAIDALVAERLSPEAIYDRLAVEDLGAAADLFRPLHNASDGCHGFVSLEVSPHLAYDASGTVGDARRYWALLDRPNAMIKVPGTEPGLDAIRALLADGINVNVTLLFGLDRYRQVLDAHMDALEQRIADGKPIAQIASVASFFVSRIDVLVDGLLDQGADKGELPDELVARLRGRTAIASARRAYAIYTEAMSGDRWQALAAQGAQPQRLLWASTSTKDPSYSDVMYVEALIGPETVNTLPVATLEAYRDHGRPARRIDEATEDADWVLSHLADAGIDLAAVTAELESEGVAKFESAFDELIDALGGHARA